jgi:hypothetical protein
MKKLLLFIVIIAFSVCLQAQIHVADTGTLTITS